MFTFKYTLDTGIVMGLILEDRKWLEEAPGSTRGLHIRVGSRVRVAGVP